MFREPLSMLANPVASPRPVAMAAPAFRAPAQALAPSGGVRLDDVADVELRPTNDGRLLLTVDERTFWVSADDHDEVARLVRTAKARIKRRA